MNKLFTLALIILFLSILVVQVGSAFDLPLASGAVYFKDQKATVDNATLKIGEPFTIKAIVKSGKKPIHIGVKLSVSGFKSNERQPYDVVGGPCGLNQYYSKGNVASNETIILEWELKATDAWVGGTAPLNFDITVANANDVSESYSVGFTIVNAYISKEYYQGVTPSPTPSPSPAKAAPGFEFVLLALSLVIALAIARGNR
jgi:sarcinarray family protein